MNSFDELPLDIQAHIGKDLEEGSKGALALAYPELVTIDEYKNAALFYNKKIKSDEVLASMVIYIAEQRAKNASILTRLKNMISKKAREDSLLIVIVKLKTRSKLVFASIAIQGTQIHIMCKMYEPSNTGRMVFSGVPKSYTASTQEDLVRILRKIPLSAQMIDYTSEYVFYNGEDVDDLKKFNSLILQTSSSVREMRANTSRQSTSIAPTGGKPKAKHQWISTGSTVVVKTGRKPTDFKTKTVYKNMMTKEVRVKKVVIRNGQKKVVYVAF